MNKVPKLRFPEFSEEWEEKKLGDICQVSNEKYNPEKEIQEFKCVELENLSQETGRILGFFNSKEQKSIKNKFNRGEVLFGKLRPYLKKYWFSEFDGVCSSEIWVLRGINDTNNKFLYTIIQTEKFNSLANISTGTKMPRADWNLMIEEIFSIPSFKEQEKIGDFLASVDSKIELQEKELDLWKKYKKGIMQKIFSQKLRFKDENGNDYPAWEEKKLGEIGKVQGGYAFKSELFKSEGIPIIRISNISNTNNYIDTQNLIFYDFIPNDELFTLKKGDLIIAMSGATTGKLSIYNLEYPAYLNQRVGVFRIDKKVYYPYFIQYCFSEKFSSQFNNVLCSSAQPNISSKDIESFSILIPSLPEQEKIANYLSSIDDKIELLEKKLEDMKTFKKALLQQMFI
jgi:type I restriction enzyme S subunit